MKILFLLLVLSLNAHANELDPALAKTVDSCKKSSKNVAQIWFFKQWHLGPKLDTSDIGKSLSLPQEQNQKALFDQLDAWISKGKLQTIIAEGCGEGEMTSQTKLKFNGWDIDRLKSQTNSPEYHSILTSVPLKLEAKYGSKIRVICGDDDELAKKNSLAFSDARGEVGYLTRLVQYKDDPAKASGYLEDVVKLYHWPSDTTLAQAIVLLKGELKKSLSQVEEWIAKRNEHLVDIASKVARGSPSTDNITIIFGGVHAAGVKALIEGTNLNCEVVEPTGYPADDRDEAKMIQRLKQLLN